MLEIQKTYIQHASEVAYELFINKVEYDIQQITPKMITNAIKTVAIRHGLQTHDYMFMFADNDFGFSTYIDSFINALAANVGKRQEFKGTYDPDSAIRGLFILALLTALTLQIDDEDNIGEIINDDEVIVQLFNKTFIDLYLRDYNEFAE